MWNPLKAELSLPSSLVQLFSSLIVQNHPALQYYLVNLEPFRALHGSDWRFCKRVGPSGSSFCKRVAFLFLSRIFLLPLLLDLIFFADVVHLVVVEGTDDVEHFDFKQCKVGIAKILSARRKVTSTHFIKGLLVYFLYPATGHKFWLLAKNENASNIRRLFPEFSGDGGVERSNVLGLRGFHSNRTSLWSGHLLPMQGFFQVTFVFRSGSYWLQHIPILKYLPPSPSVRNCFLNFLPERAWWPRTWKYTRNPGSFPKRCQESLWDKCLS